MSRDEGTYGYLGKLAAKGLTPYLDFYEMKPPMLFYFFGLGGIVFGFTDLGLRLFALLLNLCSCLLIYLILRRYIPNQYAAVSAALFSIFSLNPFAFGFSMVAEHIVNTLVLTSLYLLHRDYEQKGFLFAVLAGAAFSLAILTKQTAILFSPVILLFFILGRKNKPWLVQSLRFAGGVLIPVIILGIILIIHGAIHDAIYWLTAYPVTYASSIDPEEGKTYLRYFTRNISLFQISLFIVSVLLFFVSFIWIKKKPFHWMVAYVIMALLTIIPGFRFYGQYWLVLFVPLSMITGVVLYQFQVIKPKTGSIGLFILLALMAGEMFMHRDYYFSKGTPGEITNLYANNPFEQIRHLSKYAGNLMTDGETFMVFGSEPQAYLYADKVAPTRHVFMSMISKHDEKSNTFISETLHDLEQKQPTYVLFNFFIYSWTLTEKANDKLYNTSANYVINHYTPVAAYNMNTNSYLYAGDGQQIGSFNNQVVLFKRR